MVATDRQDAQQCLNQFRGPHEDVVEALQRLNLIPRTVVWDSCTSRRVKLQKYDVGLPTVRVLALGNRGIRDGDSHEERGI